MSRFTPPVPAAHAGAPAGEVELSVVQISDTHLGSPADAPSRNLARIASFVNEVLRPDLVVNSGDIVALDPDDGEARRLARREHDAFEAPVHYLPGNHDVGEPGEEPWMGVGVTSGRVAEHRQVFGDDRFVLDTPHWCLVGCNSELFGSGLDEEGEQWVALEQAASAAGSRSVALFLHKPIWPPRPRRAREARAGGEAARAEVALSIPGAGAERLRSLFGGRLAAVASGHLHRYRRRPRDGILEVWAPSTAFMGQTATEPAHFEQLGVVEWRFCPGSVEAWFRAPAGLEERQLHDDPQLAAVASAFRARRREAVERA